MLWVHGELYGCLYFMYELYELFWMLGLRQRVCLYMFRMPRVLRMWQRLRFDMYGRMYKLSGMLWNLFRDMRWRMCRMHQLYCWLYRQLLCHMQWQQQLDIRLVISRLCV